ncbi:putative protein transport Sec1a [Hibiscus syriacus]|uniref:SNARE-interacting protein KEULE n=1 Tax=Hibiscus syriacus TaxID=106335 RepID=A0A6A3B724_HIBSY|nr:putative protein transport Sec1a [Hibiscus syriacus]
MKDTKSNWKVLIMDKLTVKVMSYCCKMGDITAEGVSLVEDLFKRRQPLPSMDAIYFIQPTKENVVMFLSDMAGRTPLYKKAFVYFSSPVSRELIDHIKKDTTVLPRIGALSEMNLEYFTIDSQGFITDNDRALEDLFSDEENIAKLMREFPFVRYRAAKSLDPMTMTTLRDLIPTKLAAGIWNCLVKCKSIPNFPQNETCELLILDRSIDQIAPVIHEWTYDAMCHDLLNMVGNKYVHEVPGKTGNPPEKKEVLLDEHDPLWLELRHAHIADASERLHDKMTNFASKNKVAQLQHGSRDGGEISTRDLQKMIQALPQYSEQIEKLSLHVEIAGKINRIIRDQELRELGQLEQDLVFGDAGMKDVLKYFTTKEVVCRENNLRLLMIIAAIYPEKLEGEQGLNLIKLANLPPDDVNAVNNMRLLAPFSESKKVSTGGFSLKFDIHKKKRAAARKDRSGEQETWQLSRFYPIIEELVEKLSLGELSKDDYPCMNDPSPSFHGTSTAVSLIHETPVAHSMRSRRTPTWARPRGSDDGYSSDSLLRRASSNLKMGKRIFVFIAGGATRSELRVCHKLTGKLNREVVLGSTSIVDPPQFITKVKLLTANELSLDDLEI